MDQRRCFPIERHEDLAAEPAALIRDHTVREIPARRETGEAGIYGRSVYGDVITIDKTLYPFRDLIRSYFIAFGEHPSEFTQSWQCQCDEIGSGQFFLREPALARIILGQGYWYLR